MSSIHRFTIGGTADTALGVELLPTFQEPVLPATRDRSVEIPGRHGRYLFSSDLAAREIVLDLVVIDSTTAETLQSLSRAFAAILLDQDGHPEDVTLVFTKEPLKTYTVRYSGNMPLQRLIGGSKGYFSLPLIAADPFAYGAEDTDTDNIIRSNQTVTVANAGDYRTPPTITIALGTGSTDVTGFTLLTRQLISTVAANGRFGTARFGTVRFGSVAENTYATQFLSYSGTITVGDILEIDTDNMTVTLNGVNARALFNGTFPLLYVGNNELHWKDEDASRDVDLVVVHKPRYL